MINLHKTIVASETLTSWVFVKVNKKISEIQNSREAKILKKEGN